MRTKARIITRRIKKSETKYGRQCIVMLLCVMLFFCSEGAFVAFAANMPKSISFTLTEDELRRRVQIGEEAIQILVPESLYIETETEEYGVLLPVLRFFREELNLTIETVLLSNTEIPSGDYDLFLALNATQSMKENSTRQGIYQISMTAGSEIGEWMMSVWNRYQKETEEGELIPLSMFREEERYRLWEFEQKYGAIIFQLMQETPKLFWGSVSEHDLPYVDSINGTLQGKTIEFIKYFTQLTDIQLQYMGSSEEDNENRQESNSSGMNMLFEDPLDALIKNQICLLSGSVSKENRESVKRLIGVDQSEYVAVVPSDSDLTKREDIYYTFWGTLSEELASEEPEAYQNRLLFFDLPEQMIRALKNKELGGVLIRKELLLHLNETESEQFRIIPDSNLIVEDYYYGNIENIELNQLFNAVISEYRWNDKMRVLFRVTEEKAVSFETADYLLLGAGVAGGILFLICLIRLFCYSRSRRCIEMQESRSQHYSL